MNLLRNPQFLGFVFCSTLAAGVNFGSRIGFNQFMGFVPAVFFAYWCGLFTAFLLNKFLVFRNSTLSTQRQFAGFFLINLIALAQTLLISHLLGEWLLADWRYGREIGHLCGIASPIFTSYYGHKYLSFQVSETSK